MLETLRLIYPRCIANIIHQYFITRFIHLHGDSLNNFIQCIKRTDSEFVLRFSCNMFYIRSYYKHHTIIEYSGVLDTPFQGNSNIYVSSKNSIWKKILNSDLKNFTIIEESTIPAIIYVKHINNNSTVRLVNEDVDFCFKEYSSFSPTATISYLNLDKLISTHASGNLKLMSSKKSILMFPTINNDNFIEMKYDNDNEYFSMESTFINNLHFKSILNMMQKKHYIEISLNNLGIVRFQSSLNNLTIYTHWLHCL